MKTRKEITPIYTIESENIAQAVARIISDTIANTGFYHVQPECFLYNPETKLLACSYDVNKDLATCRVHANARAVSARIMIRGVRASLVIPPYLSETGASVTDWICSLEDLSRSANRAGVRLPFDLLDPKCGASFVAADYDMLYACDALARFSDPARVVSSLNAWLKMLGFEPLAQIVTNPMLAEIESAHLAAVYHCEFASDSISSVYNQESNYENAYGSCMAGKPSEWFAVYDDLQDGEALRLVHLLDGLGKRIGRALCWQGSNPDDLYLDRLYLPESNGVQIPQAIAAFRDFCTANDIRKAVFPATATKLDLTLCNLSVAGNSDLADFENYPYADSMFRVCSDNRLRNHTNLPSGVSEIGEMRETNGTGGGMIGSDNEDYVTLESGERCHRDDACYCENLGEWHLSDDCVYTIHDTTELADQCVQLSGDFYGRGGGGFELGEDCCQDYRGRWILDQDAIRMHDGEYCHPQDDEICETNGGEIALCDDCELVDEDNGVYALRQDCVELTSGDWCLADDARTLPDGSVIHVCDLVIEDESSILAENPDLANRANALLEITASL